MDTGTYATKSDCYSAYKDAQDGITALDLRQCPDEETFDEETDWTGTFFATFT